MPAKDDFDRALAKAIAELNAALQAGPEHSAIFLAQARHHLNEAIDHSKQSTAASRSPQPSTIRSIS